MSEAKVKGLVVSSIDYKEKDKLITIYTLEKGLMSAKLVGVKNPNAKLKPIKEIFCFADFDLAGSSKAGTTDHLTVTSANIIESFYGITSELDKFYSGCTILEVLKIVGKTGEPNQALFIETLKALKVLCYEDIDTNLVVIKYLLKIFEAMGYQMALDRCSSCGEPFIGKRYFDITQGEIVCQSCKGLSAEIIEPLTHSTLRLIATCQYDKLKTLKLKKEGLDSALELLVKNFSFRFDHVLRTADKLP